jgi:hypothetical protein
MLKCFNTKNMTMLTILDPLWRRSLFELRALDRLDCLVCPVCNQPVRLRAGNVKCWHFAHKHLQNCPLQIESPQLLQARSFLYNWLINHYGVEKVTVEKLVPEIPFPRPIDCWVDDHQGSFYYWIFDTRRPPTERKLLKESFLSLGLHMQPIFTSTMHHPDPADSSKLYLTTTERDFMQASVFDELIRGYIFTPGKSLHYFDHNRPSIITYRNLHLVHSPQVFSGRIIETALNKVFPMKQTGEFAHPQEQIHLEKRQVESIKRLEKQQRILPQLLRKTNHIEKVDLPDSTSNLQKTTDQHDTVMSAPFSKPSVCKICGAFTSNWVTFDGKSGTCICRNCYNIEK